MNTLRKMRPGLTTNDGTHCWLRNPIIECNHSLSLSCRYALANGNDIGISKVASPTLHSNSVPASLCSVVSIVLRGTNGKMCEIPTLSVVTQMSQLHPRRDWAMHKNPSRTMRSFGHNTRNLTAHLPIAVGVQSSGPRVAGFRASAGVEPCQEPVDWVISGSAAGSWHEPDTTRVIL